MQSGGVDREGRIEIEIHVEGKVQCKIKRGGVEFGICGLGLKGVVVPETGELRPIWGTVSLRGGRFL